MSDRTWVDMWVHPDDWEELQKKVPFLDTFNDTSFEDIKAGACVSWDDEALLESGAVFVHVNDVRDGGLYQLDTANPDGTLRFHANIGPTYEAGWLSVAHGFGTRICCLSNEDGVPVVRVLQDNSIHDEDLKNVHVLNATINALEALFKTWHEQSEKGLASSE